MVSNTEKIKLKATFLSVKTMEKLRPKRTVKSNKEHLKAAIEWLKRAQDSTRDGGVSGGYFEYIGWDASYPETTGYIIPSFFDYAHFAHDPDCERRAINMADYLLSIQMPNGAFRIGSLGVFPIGGPEVFDTGQVLQGLTRCYKETKIEKYLVSAVKAADWIVDVQEKDGSWVKYSYHGISHTFYTRVALALLDLCDVVKESKYREAAFKNVKWALTNCAENGWMHRCGSEDYLMSNPWTHFIGYAVEGIIECGVRLNNEQFIQTATRTMNALLTKSKTDGWIRASYDKNWESNDNYSCLVGNAQIALIWLRLYELTKDSKYFDEAFTANNYLKSTQLLNNWNKGVKGGIKGSQPIDGKYNRNRYLNWAAKFFVDLQMKIDTQIP
jgi:hypothetical protein